MLQDDRDHIRVVVGNGHVEGGLHGDATGVLGERLLRLQVWVGPLLEQLCRQARQATATCSVQRALPLNAGKVERLSIRKSDSVVPVRPDQLCQSILPVMRACSNIPIC